MWRLLRSSMPILFSGLWVFIALVSVIDGYLVLRSRHVLISMELNPVGRMLIALNDGDVWLLLVFKLVGTVLAGGLLLTVYRKSAALGMIVAICLASLQMCLLLFLLLN